MNILLPKDTEPSPEIVSPTKQPDTYHTISETAVADAPSSSMKYLWLTIVFILVVTSVGVGTYLIENNNAEPLIVDGLLTPTPNSLKPNDTKVVSTDPTEKWLVYTDRSAGFSIKYPPQFEKETAETATITFTALTGGYTLTMFPYDGTLEDLYEERSTNVVTKDSSIPIVFSDLPKGVMRTALVDGSKAFWYETVSDNEDEPAGREVHFITQGNGYIFKAAPKIILNETEMEQMLMSFKNVPVQASGSAKKATQSGVFR